MKFQKYEQGFRIVSLALDTYTKDDLIEDCIDFIFVDDEHIVLFPEEITISKNTTTICELQKFHSYDVFELWPDGSLHLDYDNSSIDNYFFITGKCNSNCVMCPSPDVARQNAEEIPVERLIEIARHIPSSTTHLTITGGEPFLIGEKIFPFLRFIQEKFERTEFLFLTNGRIFAIEKYFQLLNDNLPFNSILAIPIHGSTPEIHDYITCATGSFLQAVKGIKRLLEKKIQVELRVVVSKINIDDFVNISDFIICELSTVSYVSIIAMEMTGSARKNSDKVWIPYKQSFSGIEKGIQKLIRNGIDVKLYNFPLCTVDKKYWTICEKSISPRKVKYDDRCYECIMKQTCGGVFAGTFTLEREELKPIYEAELF